MAKMAKKLHPGGNWPWWKALALSLFSFGGLGIVIGVFPHYSFISLLIGLGLGAGMTIAAMWSWKTYNWWARAVFSFIWTLQFLTIAFRGWNSAIPTLWIWLAPILIAYLLAWALPAIQPMLSAFLWREQIAPKTRFGRAFMAFALAIAPVAGVLGASFGMFSSRFGERTLVLLLVGSIVSISAIGLAFAASYQLWPERPWKKGESETPKEA